MLDARERAVARFRESFHAEPALLVRAPGRVNLLGEHVDYNDGWVLPAAIDRAAWIAAATCVSPLISIASADLDTSTTFRVTELEDRADAFGRPLSAWARYPAGVAWALRQRGLAVGGVDAALASDVPIGAGLSSSAAVEVAFATMWQALGGWQIEGMALAQTCQRGENEYVGVNCGLMDQFASVHGRAGHALLFDCRTLEWEPAPLPEDTAIVIADTKVRRELGRSEYNLRRAQCEEAVRLLSAQLPAIRALRDVSVQDFRRHASLLPEVIRKRAQHVIEEIARVRAALPAARRGDASAFGAAMSASHASGRDLYEVSCPELDAMVDAALQIPGCYGARLTGAGFGGCTVNLVAAGAALDFVRDLSAAYRRRTGILPEIWVCRAAEGAGVVG